MSTEVRRPSPSGLSFEESRRRHDAAKKTIPGGVHSNIRLFEQPWPLFFDRAAGSHVYDVDGNDLIDYVLANGPLLLGHSPRPVIDAVKAQLDRGLLYAGQTDLEVEASELIVGHGAVRRARAIQHDRHRGGPGRAPDRARRDGPPEDPDLPGPLRRLGGHRPVQHREPRTARRGRAHAGGRVARRGAVVAQDLVVVEWNDAAALGRVIDAPSRRARRGPDGAGHGQQRRHRATARLPRASPRAVHPRRNRAHLRRDHHGLPHRARWGAGSLRRHAGPGGVRQGDGVGPAGLVRHGPCGPVRRGRSRPRHARRHVQCVAARNGRHRRHAADPRRPGIGRLRNAGPGRDAIAGWARRGGRPARRRHAGPGPADALQHHVQSVGRRPRPCRGRARRRPGASAVHSAPARPRGSDRRPGHVDAVVGPYRRGRGRSHSTRSTPPLASTSRRTRDRASHRRSDPDGPRRHPSVDARPDAHPRAPDQLARRVLAARQRARSRIGQRDAGHAQQGPAARIRGARQPRARQHRPGGSGALDVPCGRRERRRRCHLDRNRARHPGHPDGRRAEWRARRRRLRLLHRLDPSARSRGAFRGVARERDDRGADRRHRRDRHQGRDPRRARRGLVPDDRERAPRPACRGEGPACDGGGDRGPPGARHGLGIRDRARPRPRRGAPRQGA